MKKNLHNAFLALALILFPTFIFAQAAPNLGAASSFVVFTSAGAFNNTGASILTGDVGSYTSSPVGLAIFPDPPAPGIVINGSIYGPAPSPSLATLAQQVAVISAYDQLDAVLCGTTLVLPLAGQILTPGAYCYGAAATLNGEITLDGLGNPNALFIIKIGGAFATVGGSNVKLINGASPSNVYWQIGGEFNLVDNSAFRGNVIGNGAINMLGTSTFVGRALTKAGAISIAANRVTLAVPPPAPTITLTQPTCVLATGTITVTAPTGIGMTYSIDGTTYTNTTGIFSGLASGAYNVTAMNLDGYISTSTNVVINAAPVGLTASLTSQVNVSCFGNSNGSVVITPSGGTALYSITPAQTGLSAGLHTFTVTDANFCTTTVNATITQPATVLSASLNSQVNVSCFGNSNGSVVITPSGGTAPYSITPAQTGLSAGLHTFTVTDANLCTTTVNATITQPATVLSASLTSQVNVSCFGSSNGSVVITPSGGTAPYSITPAQTGLSAGLYTFTVTDANFCIATVNATITQPTTVLSASLNSQVNVSCFGSNTGSVVITSLGGTAPYSITPAQTGLSTGLHTFTVTDANLCTTTVNATITQPAAVLSASLTSQVNVSCFGNNTGSVVITPLGGTAPYSITPAQTGLSAGLHTFTVTDANLCTTTVNATITQPATGLTASLVSQINVMCFGNSTGSAVITTSGGTGPYTYSWNTVPVQTTATASNLSGGNYVVTVTDITGCMATANVSILQPLNALSVSVTKTDVKCFGGSTSATAIAQGGSAPYRYSWNTIPVQTTATANNLSSGNYIVTVTDNDGCIASANVSILAPIDALIVSTTKTDVQCYGGSASATAIVQGGTAPYSYSWNTLPVQTTATANNLSAGNYIVTVTDKNGCIGTANVIINQPADAILVTTTKTDVLCFGDATGSATAIVKGGTAPYQYSWNTIPVQTTATINNLKAGNYMVTVTDNRGCIATANVIINQPLIGLMVNPIQTNVLCYGEATGSATAVPTGGTAPYTYLWNTIPAQTTATVNNLPAGNYTVRVTDSNGCIATANVSITQPQPITGSAAVAIVLTGLGGTGPLIYTLNGVSNNTGIFTNIESGIEYKWSITDANNCQTASGIIGLCLNPLALVLIEKVDVLCFNGNTGSIKVEASGGNAPYEYKLNNSPYQVPGTFNSLTAGAYTVTVRDAKGLTNSVPVTITQPSLLTVTTIKTDILCEGETTGSATALAQGGTAPYSYSWNTQPEKTSVTATGLTAGIYNVIVTDANGCTATAPVTIVSSNSLPTAAFTSSLSGLNTFTFVNTSVNATSYAWDFGDGQASIDPNPIHVYATPGSYTVKLTATNSCGLDIETQVVIVPELEFFNGFSPNGDGQNDNWNIPVLNYYPANNVLIINRWGSEIWKGINYNNKDVVWTGKNMNGEDMPDGTYYYIINYDNTEKRGWVFIKR